MSDFQISVGGDFNELLKGFQQLETRAAQAGQNVGKGIGEGIQGFSSKSLAALQAELSRLESRQTRVAVDSTAFEKTGTKIREVQSLIDAVEKNRVMIGVDDKSITGLQSKLAELQNRQTKVSVDSKEFVDLQRQIDAVEGELAAVSSRKLLINADPSSIVALRSKLGDLQNELERTEIGSQRFRELQGEIRKAEQALEAAGESADGLRVLDGVIQGIAFSLSNSLVNAAGQVLGSLGNVIGEFGKLDTEIRKAAAAGGEQGGYEKLARAVDEVGIEAAGTQLEVAQLATELVRGGMTVDQANTSLAAIVRGAEATGTSFASMGSVVSASLKGFGLEATDSTRVVDALVTGANASAASVDGMGQAFKYAAPVARIMGVSVEELGIAIGLMTNAGIDASEAGVTLRNGLSKLASAAPQAGGGVGELTGQAKVAAETMAKLGINIYETDGTLKPMESTLLQLKGAFEKLDPASKVRLAANLFGGEDDGAKWLALLNQSEEEIKRLSAEMANTKGATDVARDAIQGFEMKITQLEGTLSSIATTFGKVAATALVPFIDLANGVAGVISGLPGPVKDFAAALIILVGGLVAARTAILVFQAALATTQVTAAINGITALAVTLKAKLAADVAFAAAAWPKLIAAMQAFNGVSISLGAAAAGLGTGLKATFTAIGTAGVAAFQKLTAAVASGALLTGMQALLATTAKLLLALAPLAVGVAALVVAFKVWEGTFSIANRVSKDFEESQKKVDDSLNKLNVTLGESSTVAKETKNAFQLMYDTAKETNGLNKLNESSQNLGKGFTEATTRAVEFLAELNKSGSVTEDQRKKAQALIETLKTHSTVQRELSDRYKLLAEQEERAGNPALAERYRSLSREYDSNAKANANLIQGYKEKLDVGKKDESQTEKSIELTKEQEKAVKERAAAERELNQIISEAPIRNLEAQLAVGQQLVGLSKAIGDNEQSRFAITRAGLEFELQAAEKRGASESEISQIKQRIAETDRASMEAKYKSLQQQQALELKMLELSQQKAKLEADQAVQQQLLQIKEAQAELDIQKAKGTAEEIRKAEIVLQSEQLRLGIAQEGVALLNKTQPLEAEILRLNQDTADNTERASAAQAGYRIEADGSVKATDALAQSSENVKAIAEERKKVEQEIQKVIDETAVRQVAGQLAVGEKLVSLGQALAAEEQSRFDLVKSNLEYELKKAEERGASEQEIGNIKAAIARNDRASIEARYAALLQQQQLEAQMLELTQRKAVLEANLAVQQQRIQLLESEIKLQDAIANGDQAKIGLAQKNVELQQALLGVKQEQVGILARTQPIESAILASQQNTAINTERARAAQSGFQLAAASSAVALGNAAGAAGGLAGAVSSAALVTRVAADGSIVIEQALGDAEGAAGDLKNSLTDANKPAGDIATAFTKTGDSAPAIVQGARDFASWLSSAKGFATSISDLNLETQMGVVATRTEQAAIAASDFYYWLENASKLPSGRWTGGPVEAGETYKINELGQESLLAGGRLSLINASANSLWRAPANGTVIPAGITSRLQEQGVLPGKAAAGGGVAITPAGNSNAALAVEVGKLRQEVGELARKNWNVNITTKTGPTGSQVMRQLLR
jgi:TP901 family phage tail tape measure protein